MHQLKLFLLFSLLLPLGGASAQGIAGNAAPQGAAKKILPTSGLVNVNHFTGRGSVSVPIHHFEVDRLDLGVSLSYDASGIPVDQIASSAGLGWSLDIGGYITREVNGIEDEVTTPARFEPPSPMYRPWGWYSGCTNCYNVHDTLQGILSPEAIDPHLPPFDTLNFPVYDDEEYDLFTANLGGRIIRFGFKRTLSGFDYVTYPQTDIKIDVITKDFQGGVYVNEAVTGFTKNIGLDPEERILTFTITDEYGNKFYFERGDYKVMDLDLSFGRFSAPNAIYYPAVNWILSRVVTYSGHEIRYTYARKYVEYTESQKEVLHGFYTSDMVNPLEITRNNFHGYKHHIAKIEYPDGVEVLFDLDTSATAGRCDCRGDFRLKDIIIRQAVNDNYVQSVSYRLDHAYFNTPKYGYGSTEVPVNAPCAAIGDSLDLSALTSLSSPQLDSIRGAHLDRGLRLKLKGIRKIGADQSASEDLYSFTYNPTPLVYRLDAAKDCYGYNNGGQVHPYLLTYDVLGTWDSFYLSIPYHHAGTDNPYDAVGYSHWGADRSYDFTSLQAAALTKVRTGGGGEDSIIYTDYRLENPHCSYGDISLYSIGCTVDPELEADTVNDGLVVGKIVSRNGFSVESNITTEYAYSGGKRFFRGGYFSYKEPSTGRKSLTGYFTDRHDFFNGSNHGFDTVVVTTLGFGNERLSRTRYRFSNLMYQEGGNTRSCIEKPTGPLFRMSAANFSKYRMGLPLSIEQFDELDSLLTRDEILYTAVQLPDSIRIINRVHNPDNFDTAKYTDPIYDCWVCAQGWESRLFDNKVMHPTGNVSTTFFYDPVTHLRDSLVSEKTHSFTIQGAPEMIYWTDSRGKRYGRHILYNQDLGNASPALTALNTEGVRHPLGAHTWTYDGPDSFLVSYELKVPHFDSTAPGRLRFKANYKTVFDSPVDVVTLRFPPSPELAMVRTGSALDLSASAGTHFLQTDIATRYDSRNNVAEARYNGTGAYHSNIWDTRTGNKIAQVAYARRDQVAHTSFEGAYTALGTPDENKGSFEFDPANIVHCPTPPACTAAVTGRFYFELQPNHSDDYAVVSGPLPAGEYILTFWSTDNAGSLLNVSSTSSAITTSVANAVGAWKLRTARFAAAQGDIVTIRNVPGVGQTNSLYIDEVRLYPAGAAMATYTYKPLFGIGSACDGGNNISYVEYDVFGREAVTRDMRGNIISRRETAVNSPDAHTTAPQPTY